MEELKIAEMGNTVVGADGVEGVEVILKGEKGIGMGAVLVVGLALVGLFTIGNATRKKVMAIRAEDKGKEKK